MTQGILIMHWDDRVGVEVVAKYPDEVLIQEKTLMQIYSQHEFTSEAGMVSIMAGSVNLASYYTGPDSAIYVILLLSNDEDGDTFEEGLVETSRQIMENIESESLGSILPSLFQRLSVYPKMEEEQRLSLLYNSEVKRMVLKRLRSESLVTKSEIAIWLKDQYRDAFVDLDNMISSLVKAMIIKMASVKGLASDIMFLSQDLMVLRRPPIKLFQDPVEHHLPASLKDAYTSQVRNFFLNYKPTEADNLEIITKVILDPQTYEVLKLLREAMVTKNDIEKLRKKGVDDIDHTLKSLWETKMIEVFRDDSNTEYYCLVSDFYIHQFYPKYNVDSIRKQYMNKVQNTNALLKALDIMRDEYMILHKNQKKPKTKKSETIKA
jgi:hypothetical protein